MPGAESLPFGDVLTDDRSPDLLTEIDWREALQTARDFAGDDLALLELHADGATQADLASLVDTARGSMTHRMQRVREAVLRALPAELRQELLCA